MEEKLIDAGRTLVYAVFTTGKSQHPMWAGQFRAEKCGSTLARRLAQAMRYRQGNRAEFRVLKEAGILVDDEIAMTNFFAEILQTFKGNSVTPIGIGLGLSRLTSPRPVKTGSDPSGGSRVVQSLRPTNHHRHGASGLRFITQPEVSAC